jgi:hypothetical protein
MDDTMSRQLIEKYPKIFAGVPRPDGKGNYPFWLECGKGWYDMLDTLCAGIQNHVDNKNSQYDYKVKRGEAKEEDRPNYQVVASQVKEKFGGLRFYTLGNDEFVDGLISMAEGMSYKICEVCSKPGKIGGRGWITTMCEPCRELDNKRKADYEEKYAAERAAATKEKTNG